MKKTIVFAMVLLMTGCGLSPTYRENKRLERIESAKQWCRDFGIDDTAPGFTECAVNRFQVTEARRIESNRAMGAALQKAGADYERNRTERLKILAR